MADEVWRAYPPNPKIEASSYGRVRRTLTSGKVRLLEWTPKSKGYAYVLISGGTWVQWHILVCTLFNGPPPEPGLECCHNDGVKSHNWPSNLRWDTKQANAEDNYTHGKVKVGSAHHSATLTEATVLEVWELRATGLGAIRIAKRLGVKVKAVAGIISGKNWRHVEIPAELKLRLRNAESIRPTSSKPDGVSDAKVPPVPDRPRGVSSGAGRLARL